MARVQSLLHISTKASQRNEEDRDEEGTGLRDGEPRARQHTWRGIRRRPEADPHAEDEGRGDHPAERVRSVETREERFRPDVHLCAGQEARGRRQGRAEYEHGHVRDGAYDRRRDAHARWPGSLPGDDRSSGSRHAPSDRHVGRPRWQGLDEVLSSGPLTNMGTMRWSLTLALITTVMSQPIVAQGQVPATVAEVTVDEVVVRALADNPELRAARADVDGAVGRLHQAGLRPNPELDLGGQKALSSDNNLTVAVRLPLDLNDRKGGPVAVAEQELELKRQQLADRERRLRADVRMKAG